MFGLGEVDLLRDPTIRDPQTGQEFYPEAGVEAFDIVLTANQEKKDQSQFFSKDADVLWVGLAGTQTSTYQVQFKRPNGVAINTTPVNNANIIGTAQFPVAWWPPIRIPAGGKIGLYLLDTSGAGNTIEIVFYVIRLYRVR